MLYVYEIMIPVGTTVKYLFSLQYRILNKMRFVYEQMECFYFYLAV